MLRKLIHHLPATSPYEPRLPPLDATEVQRLTTAPPWRHAPRFFLAGRPVANPVANRGVSCPIPSFHRLRFRPVTGSAARRTPLDCP
ncbi:hypothetical protein GT028_06790 [Streptomyces sp. SID2999]|nr:hypothetical protein [Streptomyces sp. SID2999]